MSVFTIARRVISHPDPARMTPPARGLSDGPPATRRALRLPRGRRRAVAPRSEADPSGERAAMRRLDYEIARARMWAR